MRLHQLRPLRDHPRQVAEHHPVGQLRVAQKQRTRLLLELVGIEPAQVRVAPGLVAVGRNRQRLIALERRRALAREPGRLRHRLRHPTEPSICSWISRFSSTAYSSGSSLVIGSTNPETIIAEASSSDSPRLIR